jgi:hypothetical protein
VNKHHVDVAMGVRVDFFFYDELSAFFKISARMCVCVFFSGLGYKKAPKSEHILFSLFLVLFYESFINRKIDFDIIFIWQIFCF